MVRIKKLNYKLLRDIKAAKFQFGAVVLIILLGVALFIGAYTAYLNLDQSYNTSFKNLHMADYWISVDHIDERAAREMDDIPGVTAQGRIIGDVQIDMSEETGERVEGRVISLPAYEHPGINDVMIDRGSYFSSTPGREILVEKHFADYYKLKPGDWLTLKRDGNTASYKIAGIVVSPEYIWVSESAQNPMPTPRTFGVLFMPQPAVENLFDMRGIVNEIDLLVEPGTDRNEVMDEVQLILKRNYIKRITSKDDPVVIYTRKIDIIQGVRTAYMVERSDQISYRLLRQDLDSFQLLAFLFPLLFLSMASLTIYVLLSRLVESQRVQIGLMRGLGYSRAAILGHYVGFSLFVGLIGSLLGVALGQFLGRGLTTMYVAELNLPFIINTTHWGIIFTGVLIGTLIPVIAGLIPAWSTMKMQPATAMRPAPPASGRKAILEIILPFLSRLPYVLKLPMRNIFRNPRRSFYMALGIASSVSLIIVSMSFFDAMEKSINTQFDIIQKYDALIRFQGTGAASTAAYVKNLGGVDNAEAILEMPYRIRFGDNYVDSSIMGLPKNSSMYNLQTSEGTNIDVVDDGILIPVPLKDDLGAKIGDTVNLEPLVGTVGETQKRIAGYVDIPIGGRAFMPLRETQKLIHSPGGATGILLTFNGAPSPTLLKKLYNLPQVASIEFSDDFKRLIDEMMGFFWVFIGVMLAMGAALGIAIIFNSVTVNVLQRIREIALMRAVGMRTAWINTILTLENFTVGIFGVLLGIPLGRFIADWFFKAMATSSEDITSITLTIFPRTYIIAVVSALVILLVSQIPAMRQIQRLSLATAIKDWYE
jgi:putative ABC transport system permease protein